MYLIGSIPPVRTKLRKEYLYNLESHHGEFIDCVWVGLTVLQSRALGFRVVTSEGVQFGHLPITAFTDEEDAKPMPIDMCQLWDCFSYSFGVHEFRWLKHAKVKVLMKDRSIRWGDYLFTVSFSASDVNDGDFGYAEDPDVKDCHIIRLDEGNFVAQPNNRILIHDFDFVTKPLDLTKKPDFKIFNHQFTCETAADKWLAADTDDYFYDIHPRREYDRSQQSNRNSND